MKKRILITLISLILVAGIVFAAIYSKKRKEIPDNPPSTVGNLSGNLNNGGYFCESDGYIYFSNFNDHHYLYKMKSNGTGAELVKDVPVSYINAGGDYLYFYYDDQGDGDAKFMGFAGQMMGIYRIKKDGEDLHSLLRCKSGVLNLIGSDLYFEHYDNAEGMTLYRASISGKVKEQAVNAIINPACAVDGNIYFSDQANNLYLSIYRPGGNKPVPVTEYSMFDPVLAGGYLYFLNLNDDYCLYRYGLSTGSLEKVTGERVDAFNVYDDVIFYQRLKNPALVKVNADGSNACIIAEGTYTNINCTSTFTFFNPFGDETVYVTPTFGNGNVGTFNP